MNEKYQPPVIVSCAWL